MVRLGGCGIHGGEGILCLGGCGTYSGSGAVPFASAVGAPTAEMASTGVAPSISAGGTSLALASVASFALKVQNSQSE